ncbi:MAG: hypothetical protein V2A76_18505 [Planctomycetota bacterium]
MDKQVRLGRKRQTSELPAGARAGRVTPPVLRALFLVMALGSPQGCGLMEGEGGFRDAYSGASYADVFVAVDELLDCHGRSEVADYASGRIETAWRADELFQRRGVERRSRIVARITHMGEQVEVWIRVATEVRRPGPDSPGWAGAPDDDEEAAIISQTLRMRLLSGRPEEVPESRPPATEQHPAGAARSHNR